VPWGTVRNTLYRTGIPPRGTCGDGAAPLLKPIIAKPGDVVEVSYLGLSVNGTLLPNTAPLATDTKGLWKRGRQDVMLWHPKPLWVASPFHRCSFDSRYFGPVSTTAIRHRLKALLIL
jgi:type IV secretory pathway protease TraF